VLAVDAAGEHVWSDTYGATPGNDADRGTGVAVEPEGDVYVSGLVWDDQLLWLRRYAPDGSVLWTEQAGSAEPEIGTSRALTLAEDGLPVVVGDRLGAGWIAKYDDAGTMLWDAEYAGEEGIQLATVGTDPAGNLTAIGALGVPIFGVAVTVSFDPDGALRWGDVGSQGAGSEIAGGVAPDGRALAVQDGFSEDGEWVVRMHDAAGAAAGAFLVAAAELRRIHGVAFDPSGDVYFVGDRDGQAWIRRTDPAGDPIWERTFGDGALHAAAVDVDGSVVVTGCLDGDVAVRRFAP
jgi:hypothetical protein